MPKLCCEKHFCRSHWCGYRLIFFKRDTVNTFSIINIVDDFSFITKTTFSSVCHEYHYELGRLPSANTITETVKLTDGDRALLAPRIT
jgi:hypothetical protein